MYEEPLEMASRSRIGVDLVDDERATSQGRDADEEALRLLNHYRQLVVGLIHDIPTVAERSGGCEWSWQHSDGFQIKGMGSACGLAAVDPQDLAGDKRSLRRGDEGDGLGDLLRLCAALGAVRRRRTRLSSPASACCTLPWSRRRRARLTAARSSGPFAL